MSSKRTTKKPAADNLAAVGYVRVSTPDQVLGIDAQRAALTAWADRAGVELVAVYEDAAAGQSLCFVMAYCEGGDLARLIKTHAEKVLWAPIALNHASNAASDCMLSVI